MIRKIKGKVYDTDKATMIGRLVRQYTDCFNRDEEILYLTSADDFFMVYRWYFGPHAPPVEKLNALEPSEGLTWLDKYEQKQLKPHVMVNV